MVPECCPFWVQHRPAPLLPSSVLSKVHGNLVDIGDREPLHKETKRERSFLVFTSPIEYSGRTLRTGFIMNIAGQSLGQLLIWGLLLVSILKLMKQNGLYTDF